MTIKGKKKNVDNVNVINNTNKDYFKINQQINIRIIQHKRNAYHLHEKEKQPL